MTFAKQSPSLCVLKGGLCVLFVKHREERRCDCALEINLPPRSREFKLFSQAHILIPLHYKKVRQPHGDQLTMRDL